MRGFTFFAIVLALGCAGPARGAEQPALDPPAQKIKTAQEELLERKLAELAVLQDEIRDLRHATGRQIEIVLQVQVVELSRTKMRDLGGGLENALQTTEGADSKTVAELVSLLKRKQALKVLTEPALLVSDGRPGHFFNGGQVSVPVTRADGSKTVEGRKIGTQIDLVANHTGGEWIHLNFRATQSELEPALSGTIEKVAVPGLRSREIDTALEMKLGQTAILGGGAEGKVVTVVRRFGPPSEVVHEVETLFLVTPQLIEGKK
jgi:type II secretory pathway component HofQ